VDSSNKINKLIEELKQLRDQTCGENYFYFKIKDIERSIEELKNEKKVIIKNDYLDEVFELFLDVIDFLDVCGICLETNAKKVAYANYRCALDYFVDILLYILESSHNAKTLYKRRLKCDIRNLECFSKNIYPKKLNEELKNVQEDFFNFSKKLKKLKRLLKQYYEEKQVDELIIKTHEIFSLTSMCVHPSNYHFFRTVIEIKELDKYLFCLFQVLVDFAKLNG